MYACINSKMRIKRWLQSCWKLQKYGRSNMISGLIISYPFFYAVWYWYELWLLYECRTSTKNKFRPTYAKKNPIFTRKVEPQPTPWTWLGYEVQSFVWLAAIIYFCGVLKLILWCFLHRLLLRNKPAWKIINRIQWLICVRM